jgi:hypothetical protein
MRVLYYPDVVCTRRHTGGVTDFLAGLDAVDWTLQRGAYGDASELPGQLRALTDPSRQVRDDSCTDMFQTVNHQSTLYECAPAAVPFLVEVATTPCVVDDDLRAVIAYLLASLLLSGSSCLDGRYYLPVSGDFRTAEPVPRRDLFAETWSALSAWAEALSESMMEAPLELRSALLAAVGVIGPPASASTRARVLTLTRDDHPLISAQAELAGALLDGATPTVDDLRRVAAFDADVAEFEHDLDEVLPVVRARRLLIAFFETIENRERKRRRKLGE